MKNLEKIGLPVVGFAMLVFGGLWIAEVQSNVKLTRELGASRDQLSDKEAELRGLLAANRRLQLRLQEIPVLALFDEGENGERPKETMTLSPEVWEEFQAEEQPVVVNADGSTEEASTDRSERNGRSNRGDRERTPEEEAERAARREERDQQRLAMRQQMNDELQARREFFSLINTDGLSPEYAAANTRVVEAMGEMQVLLAQMSVEDLDRDERRELHTKMRETYREVDELMATQQDILLYDYAEIELGLDPKQQQAFIEYMKAVDEYTTLPRPSRRMSGASRR